VDLEFARKVIRAESDAVACLGERIGEGFERAGRMILERTGVHPDMGGARVIAPGRLAVTGVGKAGKIGDKLSATFASTGTPSFFLNPVDALHGDLGMLSSSDVLLALSNSGKTQEILRLIPHVRKIGACIVAVTGDDESPMAAPESADIVISLGKIDEAGELGLAPSSSTTAMLALGDALALCVQKERRFTGEEYARFHPAGELAKQAVRVRDIMRTGDRVPACLPETTVMDAMKTVTAAHAGCVSVLDGDDRLLGVFTNGDFGRVVARDAAALSEPVSRYMTKDPKRIGPDRLVAEAMGLMRNKKINQLPVVDDAARVVGLLDIQDIVGLRLEV
jgi:arabinose-5-phosphate isomerase